MLLMTPQQTGKASMLGGHAGAIKLRPDKLSGRHTVRPDNPMVHTGLSQVCTLCIAPQHHVPYRRSTVGA